MEISVPTTYKSLDLNLPKLLPRSDLNQLKPVGVGTPLVESLTGYVARLAESHCVFTGILVLSKIAPLIKEGYVFAGREGGINPIFGSGTKALNGIGSTAAALVQALEALTLRSELRFLTMLAWANVIPSKDLPNRMRAWCPICYDQWRVSQNTIYEPLLWSLAAVKTCPLHHQRLCNQCPHCHNQLPLLGWRSRPGFCSKCSGWLGVSQNSVVANSEVQAEDELKWQTYVLKNVGDLLATAPNLPYPPPRERIKKVISAYVERVAQSNISELARILSISRSKVWPWYTGRVLPSLNTLLEICYSLGVSVSDFLIKEDVVASFSSTNTLFPRQLSSEPESFNRQTFNSSKARQELEAALKENPPPSIQEVTCRLGYKSYVTLYEHFKELCCSISARHNDYKNTCRREKLLTSLKNVLDSNEYPPLSLKETARQIGCSTTTLYSNFPDLAYEIAARYTKYRKTSHQELISQICFEVKQVALQLHADGITPTARRVAVLLSKPGVIRNQEVRAALDELRRELS